jgi:hypothetical protein
MRILDGSRVEPHQNLLRFAEAPSIDNGAALALDHENDVSLESDAWLACQELAAMLEADPWFGERIDLVHLRLELLRETGRVLRSADVDRSAASLMDRLRRYVRKSVVVVPVGGMYSSTQSPLEFERRVVVGHVSQETERAIADLARSQSLDLAGFRFTHDAWWTEEFLAAEADPYIAEELAQDEAARGTWQPLVVAVALDGVGDRARYMATVCTEALIGAALALDDPRNLDGAAPPWILGESTFVEYPRAPSYGDDFTLPTTPLVVDTRPGHEIEGRGGSSGRIGLDRDLGELDRMPEAHGVLSAAVVGFLDSDMGTTERGRFASACQMFGRVVAGPPDVSLVLAAATLRLLGFETHSPDPRVPMNTQDAPSRDEALDPTRLCELVDEYLNGDPGAPSISDLALARHDGLHMIRRELLAAHARLLRVQS